jgi:hypothetical protein
MTILTSPTLTEFKTKRDHHKSRFKSACSEFRRVTKLQRPEAFYETSSVTAMMPVAKRTIAAPPENLANRTIGTSAADDAKRRQDDLEATLKGEPLAERTDTKARLDEINRQAQAEQNAIEHFEKLITAEKYRLAVAHCQKLKPREAEIMRRLYKALAEVHAVHSELDDMRQGLIEDGIGLRDICLLTPEFLEHPRSKHSPLAEFFKAGKLAGFTEVPKDLL